MNLNVGPEMMDLMGERESNSKNVGTEMRDLMGERESNLKNVMRDLMGETQTEER